MFAAGTCSADSSTSTTASPHDRIRVSDPHGEKIGTAKEYGEKPGEDAQVIRSRSIPNSRAGTNSPRTARDS